MIMILEGSEFREVPMADRAFVELLRSLLILFLQCGIVDRLQPLVLGTLSRCQLIDFALTAPSHASVISKAFSLRMASVAISNGLRS